MNIRETLRLARQLATPSKYETATIELAAKAIQNRLNNELKRRFIKAKAICGGSFAKGTWLPNTTDIDIFVAFNYPRHKNKSDTLADILEPAIESAFGRYKRLHGSRDYFQVGYDNYLIEFVPVLKIRKPARALNITDVSPLHVKWTHKKSKKTRLANEIRLGKLFFRAAGVYGAESYIHGFSGHVTEILIAKYGSFLKLARASQNWKPKVYIDPERHYYTKNRAMRKLNKAKLLSPLIVIDPIQPERNAAAALDIEKFRKLIAHFRKLLAKPDINLFKEKTITIDELKANTKKRKLVILRATPQDIKKDIAGAKLLKQFEKLTTQLKLNDFKILKKGWQWKSLSEDALFWFYFDKKLLPTTRKHYGPPLKANKDRIDSFLDKYGKKARRDSKQLYVILSREHRTPESLIKSLLKAEDSQNVEVVTK